MEDFSDETLQHEDETETNALIATRPGGSQEDNLRAMGDKANARCFVPLWGLVFYTMAFACSLRANLSVAIVAMVNQTALNGDVVTNATNTSGTDQCPRDPEQQHTDGDGEFTWDRHQQTAALAAYYYGSIITQVRSNKI